MWSSCLGDKATLRLKPWQSPCSCAYCPVKLYKVCLSDRRLLQSSRNDSTLKCRVHAQARSNDTRKDSSGPDDSMNSIWTEFVAETLLPTQQGKFRLRGYRHTVDGGRTFTEPSAIISGEVEKQKEVVVRVHDACFTSEVLGSLKCDCREQLQLALQYIHDNPPGMVIYLQQEGRGIGLANKIAAYALQEKGLDTVDANRALGLPDDCREYSAVKHILNDLDIDSIVLMTNNPRKIVQMESLGIKVNGRVPCIVSPTEFNEGYLSAKEARMDHMLSDDGGSTQDDNDGLDGSFCYWNHEGEPSSSGVPLESDTGIDVDYEQVQEALASGKIKQTQRQPTKNNNMKE